MKNSFEQKHLDPTSNTLKSIDYAHHEIHSGSSFTCGRAASIGIGETIVIHIKTADSDKRAHLLGAVGVSGEVNVQWIEDVSITGGANGTAITTVCRRRDSRTKTAETLVYHTPTYSGGTSLGTYHTGSGRGTGGEIREADEWILAPDTSYILLVTSEANTVDAQVTLNWYEHTDKDR